MLIFLCFRKVVHGQISLEKESKDGSKVEMVVSGVICLMTCAEEFGFQRDRRSQKFPGVDPLEVGQVWRTKTFSLHYKNSIMSLFNKQCTLYTS